MRINFNFQWVIFLLMAGSVLACKKTSNSTSATLSTGETERQQILDLAPPYYEVDSTNKTPDKLEIFRYDDESFFIVDYPNFYSIDLKRILSMEYDNNTNSNYNKNTVLSLELDKTSSVDNLNDPVIGKFVYRYSLIDNKNPILSIFPRDGYPDNGIALNDFGAKIKLYEVTDEITREIILGKYQEQHKSDQTSTSDIEKNKDNTQNDNNQIVDDSTQSDPYKDYHDYVSACQYTCEKGYLLYGWTLTNSGGCSTCSKPFGKCDWDHSGDAENGICSDSL